MSVCDKTNSSNGNLDSECILFAGRNNILRFDDVSDFDNSGALETDDLDAIPDFALMDADMDLAADDTVITFNGGGTLTSLDANVADFASITANVEVNTLAIEW